MRCAGRLAITSALLLPLVASPADAQSYRWDIGLNGGGSWYSALLQGEDVGASFDEARFKAGWLAGGQLGFWITPTIGLRANATYTDRPLNVDNSNSDSDVYEHINLWSGTGDLMVRFGRPNNEFTGTEVLPYIAGGLGMKWVNPAGDAITCRDTQENKQFACAPFNNAGQDGGAFALAEDRVLMGLVGLGTDVRFARNLALRLEVNDRIYKPELHTAISTATPNLYDLPNGDERVGKTVHEVGAQVGLHMLFGMARPTVVTVAAPPPPPVEAPVVTQPAPPPPPREEPISVCVVDPTASGGLRTQSAIFLPETGDTLVVMNGERMPLRNHVGNVMIARDADWYVRGQPLVLTVGSNRIEYLTFQGARQIEPSQLAFVGTINGYPVYADRNDVADIIGPIETLRTERPGADLGVLLADRRDLRERFETVKYLYVPLEPTGCVFQTVQVMEQVRKGKQQ